MEPDTDNTRKHTKKHTSAYERFTRYFMAMLNNTKLIGSYDKFERTLNENNIYEEIMHLKSPVFTGVSKCEHDGQVDWIAGFEDEEGTGIVAVHLATGYKP